MIAGAEVLTRKEAMKEVVGPTLTTLLSPIYVGEFTDREQAIIPTIGDTRDLQYFSSAAAVILARRCMELSPSGEHLDQINKLHETIGLFHRRTTEDTIDEGRLTGVMVPLGVASHIAILEDSPDSRKDFDPYTFNRSIVFSLDVQALMAIMNRPSFDDIILTLAKGHNGTLGARTTNISFKDPYFFDFQQEKGSRLPLPEAYELDKGKVTGLSSQFRLAAAATRRTRVELLTEAGDSAADVKDMLAGCPVRHAFADETGILRDPLIVTSNGFLIGALQVAQAKQVLEPISS